MADQKTEQLREITRRHLFQEAGYGIGGLALASLMNEGLLESSALAQNNVIDPMKPKPPHFKPKAKSIIFLSMPGAPSTIDMFDHKPKLNQYNGQPIPDEFVKGERFAFIKGVPKLLGSPHHFAPRGKSGQIMSDILPHLAKVADEISVIRSMHTDQFNHAPAQILMSTGSGLPGRPAMGSWLTYGLGSESRDLPGFVVLISGQNNPDGGKSCWSSGFLPTLHQGVEFRSKGEPVLFVSNPEGVDRQARRETLDALKDLNDIRLKKVGDPEIATRISAYELAYRMQASVPELMDISHESPATHALYGTQPGKSSFANNCLLARRLVERGARFIQLYHRGWDHHGTNAGEDLINGLPRLCREVDQASAALITDLKQRGLLENTLVVWGGEFGRTPMNEERDGSKFMGRDHHPHSFAVWMAGGGIKPGLSIGKTDELGYRAVEDAVHVHDLHATMLHLMGIDHTRLTFRFQGRDYRLTDVYGNVVTKLLA